MHISPTQLIREAHAAEVEELDLSWNTMRKLSSEIGLLTNLKKLDLSSNHLTTLPTEISKLTKLEILILKNNELSELLPEIKYLQNLKELYIQNNKINSLPDGLDMLKKLKIIDIHNNNITDIPKEIGNMTNLEVLDIKANPIKNIPKEIINRGAKAITNYLIAIKSSQQYDYLCEAKLLLVGRGGRGKTSIVKKLREPNYELEDKIMTTEGIDIKEWYLNDIKLEKSNKFRFNIWDFAGQEKYDATHQFFLTKRSLYFFVTDARQEDNYLDFDYWLNIIKLRSNNSPVIIIQNKIDERKKELPTQKYKQLFPNIHSFVKVSCKSGYEDTISFLIREVKSAIKELPQIGDELPKSWVDIRKEIENFSKAGVNYISYQEYLDVCSRYELSESQSLLLSQYYNDLGIIVHHQEDLILQNTVIINPDWVVDGVYSVLDTEKVQKKRGKFTDSDLVEIWQGNTYKNKRAELLQLMKNYELCFELGNSKTYIAPELLTPDPPHYKAFRDDDKIFHFQYHYEFMPSGIITRFIVRTHQYTDDINFWRYGVVLKHENSFAEVIEDDINRKIKIKISGKSKKELLGIIRMEFKVIHNSFHGLNFQEMVAIDEFGKHFRSYSELVIYADMKKPVFIPELRKEFDAQLILSGIIEAGLNKESLKRDIAKGKTEKVLKDIYRVYNDNNIVIAQLGRLNEMKAQINLGTISNEDKKLEENKLRVALLELIDNL